MELQRPWGAGALCIALCLVSAANSAPHHYLALPPGVYQPQMSFARHQRQQPLYYVPNASPRIAAAAAGNPVGSATSLKYLAVSHPQAPPNQRYLITPYISPSGFFPVAHSQVTSLGPEGYQNNNQYLVYPAGTEFLRANQRQTAWENFVNFIGGIPFFNRPNNEAQKPPQEQELPSGEMSEGMSGGMVEGSQGTQGSTAGASNGEGSNTEGSVAEVAKPEDSQASGPNVETIMSPNVEGAESAEASEALSRLIARSRALPRKEEGEEGTEVIEEEKEEEEKEDEDSVVIGPGGNNPSVAQAKPAAIALAGVGGVAAAAPTATAVVGANGLAVAAPSATAVAGPSAGSPPPGLLPKGTRVRPSKISPEEARINAARIYAARQSAYDMVAGMRMAGIQSLPILAYQV